MVRRLRTVLALILTACLMASVVPGLTLAAPFGEPAFQNTWARTDHPVATLLTSRTWMWGPEPFTDAFTEPYREAPGGQRTVQYFDKSRMEITDPHGDRSSIWFVTNGLIAKELITGRMQVGDYDFEDRQAAVVNVAGDQDDPNGPTYASFALVLDAPAHPAGTPMTQRIDRHGTVTDDPSLATYGVTAAIVVPETGHSVASVFWDFMNSSGLVYEGGRTLQDRLFVNPFYATGFPLTEPYWATVRVGGTPTTVLAQVFERRVLTYTPDNPAGWKVEAGNVGQHYYTWRYESDQDPVPPADEPPPPPPSAPAPPPATPGSADRIFFERYPEILVADLDKRTTPPARISNVIHEPAGHPTVSPDGRRVAYVEGGSNGSAIMIADLDKPEVKPTPISNVLRGQYYYDAPAWSPDGQSIAFVRRPIHRYWSEAQKRWLFVPGAGEILIAKLDAPDAMPTPISNVLDSDIACEGGWLRCAADYDSPAWAPDGRRIAFTERFWRWDDEAEVVIRRFGVLRIADLDRPFSAPVPISNVLPDDLDYDSAAWTPDGSDRIAFVQRPIMRVYSEPSKRWYHVLGPGAIYVADLNTPFVKPTPITDVQTDVDYRSPTWAPDGSRIAFSQQGWTWLGRRDFSFRPSPRPSYALRDWTWLADVEILRTGPTTIAYVDLNAPSTPPKLISDVAGATTGGLWPVWAPDPH